MIDFAPTEEQAAIRDLARQIAMEQFRKLARPADEACATPDHLFELLGQTGLLSPFPEEYGGAGAQSAVTHALIAEELAYGDGGLGLSYIGALLPGLAVLIAGDEGHKRELLPPCQSRGGSLGWSEPASGWDVRQMTSTLTYVGDDWHIEVNKRGVIHGQAGRLPLALVRLADAPGLDGLRLIVLPEKDPSFGERLLGVSYERKQPLFLEVIPEKEPLGLRAAPRAHVRARDNECAALVLGNREKGGAGAQRFVALANVLLGALAVGIARAALDYAADYAKGRVQFGKPISSFQAIAFMAAEMAMETDAARLLLWRAAYAWDAEEDALRRAERARMQAVKVAQRVTTDAVQILGGAGFLQDHPVELWMRDAEALAALG